MAMSQKAISGFGGSVTVDSATAVEVSEWSADWVGNGMDSTHLGSSGYIEEKYLSQQVTGTLTAHEALPVNTSHRWVKLQLSSSGSGIYSLRFRARHDLAISNGQDKVSFDHSFRSTGPITVVS